MFLSTVMALIFLASQASDGSSPDAAENVSEASSYDDLSEQFVLTLPAGWFAYDQNSIFGKKSPHGVVVFSAVDLASISIVPKGEDPTPMIATFGDVDSGKIPSFIVERFAGNKNNSCVRGFAKKEQARMVKNLKTFHSGRDRQFVVTGPVVENAVVGGCQGLRIRLGSSGPNGPWEILIYAAADGVASYNFGLRTKKEHFDTGLPYFENAMTTLQMTASREN